MNGKTPEFRTWHNGRLNFAGPHSNKAMVFFFDGKPWDENCDKEHGILTEYTHANDKCGKKIFEGDIVLWNNPDPYDGEDFLVKTVGYNNRTMGYRLYTFAEEIGTKAGSAFFPEDVEVIGNIFEGASKDGVDYGKWRVVV